MPSIYAFMISPGSNLNLICHSLTRMAVDFSEENIVVIEGHHNIQLDVNASFYQIRSKEEAPYDLIFTNQINGKPLACVNVLFLDEESFKFDLSFY